MSKETNQLLTDGDLSQTDLIPAAAYTIELGGVFFGGFWLLFFLPWPCAIYRIAYIFIYLFIHTHTCVSLGERTYVDGSRSMPNSRYRVLDKQRCRYSNRKYTMPVRKVVHSDELFAKQLGLSRHFVSGTLTPRSRAKTMHSPYATLLFICVTSEA